MRHGRSIESATYYAILYFYVPLSCRYGFAHIGRVGSVFITLSVTIERFFAITYPLKKLNLKRWLILSSVSGAVLYNLPRFFELRYGLHSIKPYLST